VTTAPRSDRNILGDAELLAQISQGDLESLGTLFDRYERHVRRFLHRVGHGAGDLDDLVQQTFLQVPTAAKRFDGRPNARPRLLGIAATVARRERSSLSRVAARLRGWAQAAPSTPPLTPAESFEEREMEERFARALDRLSPAKREVFALVTLEGASGEEAAEARGIPRNTVWTRLHHARRELRKTLEEGS
jgi:RNA polymerase sigma-70 factor, ECF subfamily